MRRTVTCLVTCALLCACAAQTPSRAVPPAGRTAGPATARHVGPLARVPDLGLACPRPNSLACDRVGLGVWLDRPAVGVTATIAGRPLSLHAGGFGGRGPKYWEGYLQPAGLLAGPLKVTPDGGRDFWAGGHPKYARLVITVYRTRQRPVRTAQVVELRPGWG
jgi:hypothetical protein